MTQTQEDPAFVLGTMTFGQSISESDAFEALKRFLAFCKKSGYQRYEVDTAYMYEDGKSEEILGRCLKRLPADDQKKVYVASKVNSFDTSGKSLSKESTTNQINTILKRLEMDSIDLLYLHNVDSKVPIEETLEAVQEAYKQGKFKE